MVLRCHLRAPIACTPSLLPHSLSPTVLLCLSCGCPCSFFAAPDPHPAHSLLTPTIPPFVEPPPSPLPLPRYKTVLNFDAGAPAPRLAPGVPLPSPLLLPRSWALLLRVLLQRGVSVSLFRELAVLAASTEKSAAGAREDFFVCMCVGTLGGGGARGSTVPGAGGAGVQHREECSRYRQQ